MVEVKQQYNRSKNKERKKLDVEMAPAVVQCFQQNVKGRVGPTRAV